MLVAGFILGFLFSFLFFELSLSATLQNKPRGHPHFVGSLLEWNFTVLNWGSISWFQLNCEREWRDPWKNMNIAAER